MPIVRMQRIRLIGLSEQREHLFRELMRLGCVELTDASEKLSAEEWSSLLQRDASDTAGLNGSLSDVKSAIATLDHYARVKKGLFEPRREIRLGNFFDFNLRRSTLTWAKDINGLQKKMDSLHAEEGRLTSKKAFLVPWEGLDVNLDISGTKGASFIFGICPGGVLVEDIKAALNRVSDEQKLFHPYCDREQHCMLIICHSAVDEDVLNAMKAFGFTRYMFKEYSGTARENIGSINNRLREISQEIKALECKIKKYKELIPEFELAVDLLGLAIERESSRGSLLSTDKAFFMEGWAVGRSVPELRKVLDRYDCAYEFSEPEEGDNVPVKLYNTELIRPFNMVTEMYSLPDYRNIDPNPLFALFFTVFFGIMYGDAAYGLILVALGLFVTLKIKPRGIVNNMFRLMIICGISTVVFGSIFGGFFGDAIAVIGKSFFNMGDDFKGFTGVFNPLENTLLMLYGSLVLGAIQVFAGMCVKVYLLCRDGRPLDAVMDVGSWWLLFAGIALLALGVTQWVAIAGVAALVLTQGRSSKSIPGKLIGGIASLYDITSYLSDILSYSRLMALALATSVIASVFNILAGLVGGVYILGPLLFIAVFLIGHAFNMGINIVGTYVHAARLQYLEYFSKFYEGGGTPFRPLAIKTKFVDVIREEQE